MTDYGTTENKNMDQDQVVERIHALEVAQATEAAALAGAQATQAAAHAGTWATMTVGSVALVVGMFLGITLKSTR